MDKRELFFSCKTGNLIRIRYLVEEKDVELNVRDKWDGTPLYYACLCGHFDVVLYLLQNGATCDENTFDGERCLYGALTDNIRHLLINFKVITATTMRRDKYSEFLRRTFETSEYSDVEFLIENEKILAHRSILVSRSKCFQDLFSTSWKDKTLIDLTHLNIIPGIFKNVLQYLYMGEVSVVESDIEAFIYHSKKFNMYHLVAEIERILSLREKISVLYMKPNLLPQQDYLKLYLSSLPKEFRIQDEFEEPQFADLYIKVDDYVFTCHKVFVCGRCSYLSALVTDHFSEFMCNNSDIQEITLHRPGAEIFSKILEFIYIDSTDLSPENILEVLSYADLFILPGLKKLCSNVAQQNFTANNIVSVIRIARLYDLPRLEAQCTEYMAKHLEEVIDQQEFKNLVLDDANEIKNRQETDTITVVDDIRSHIDHCVEICDGFKRHLLIANLLEMLNLEA